MFGGERKRWGMPRSGKKLLFELLKKVKYIHLFFIGSKIMKSIRKKGYGKYFILYSKFEYKCN